MVEESVVMRFYLHRNYSNGSTKAFTTQNIIVSSTLEVSFTLIVSQVAHSFRTMFRIIFLFSILSLFTVTVTGFGKITFILKTLWNSNNSWPNFHFMISEIHKTKEITIHYAEGDKCGYNRKYTYCGSVCRTTCRTCNKFCEPECVRGCLCARGHAESSFFAICVPNFAPLCKWDRFWNWCKLLNI